METAARSRVTPLSAHGRRTARRSTVTDTAATFARACPAPRAEIRSGHAAEMAGPARTRSATAASGNRSNRAVLEPFQWGILRRATRRPSRRRGGSPAALTVCWPRRRSARGAVALRNRRPPRHLRSVPLDPAAAPGGSAISNERAARLCEPYPFLALFGFLHW